MKNQRYIAPIVLFTYNRLWHTQQTVESLLKNELAKDSDLFIFSDGAKNEEDQVKVQNVRNYLTKIDGFKSITIEESLINKGLANSIIYGVTKIINKFGKIIVLEDDLITSNRFLDFMNDALSIYENHTQVGMVHGQIYTIDNLPETFFSYKAGCLGWGTWSDRWKSVNFDGVELLQLILEQNLMRKFNLNNSYPYTQMLKDQINGKNSSWAIRVYASFLLQNKLVYYPNKSFVAHIGFDSGTHCYGANKSSSLDGRVEVNTPIAQLIPIIDNTFANKKIEQLYNSILHIPIYKKIINNFKRPYRHGLIKIKVTKKVLQRIFKKPKWHNLRSTKPISKIFGLDRGKPIDRVYIENFLSLNSKYINGVVCEIAENTYSKQFGNNVIQYEVLHIDNKNINATIIGDLCDINSLPENYVDCFICTQTLNFIYDFKLAIKGIHHILKPNGTALITVAGLSQISRYDMDRWGDYWRFTTKSMQQLFEDIFDSKVIVNSYGNVLTATALLHGISAEELSKEELEYNDHDYQILITIKVTK